MLEIEEMIVRKEISKLKEHYLTVEPTLKEKGKMVEIIEGEVS